LLVEGQQRKEGDLQTEENCGAAQLRPQKSDQTSSLSLRLDNIYKSVEKNLTLFLKNVIYRKLYDRNHFFFLVGIALIYIFVYRKQ
jgi:hypothetical protein